MDRLADGMMILEYSNATLIGVSSTYSSKGWDNTSEWIC